MPINHWCSSKEPMDQSLSCINHFREQPPLSISSSYERGTCFPVSTQPSPIICPMYSIIPLLRHSTWSTAITIIAMPSPLLLNAAFGEIYQNVESVPSWNFKQWPLKSKHNLHHQCVALASCNCSSQCMTLMWPQTPLVLSFGRDLRGLGRARLTSSQDGLLFPGSEDLQSHRLLLLPSG